ncbi:MAG: UbiX family flavin prenyltransferase [Clostridia bacterium]|nr:UbiX family flavin prenyltransferase [Clostridia bacterium]
MDRKRIVLGVSGASGVPLAERLLRELQNHPEVETHLVVTYGGERTIEEECAISAEEFEALADVVYDNRDIGAAIASGSFPAEGMIVLPCSMKTVAGIAHGYSDNLLLRAADVTIKEQRRLILVPREVPLSKIHLDNLAYLAAFPGVFILPPVMSYYHHPRTLEEMEDQIVGRILSLFGIETAGFRRWNDG